MLRAICFGLGVILAVAVSPQGLAQSPVCSKTIEFGAIDWPPYIAWQDDATPTGLDISLIKAIFNMADCAYSVTKRPFKRTLRDIENGDIDGSPLISFTEDRARFGYYSLPLRPEIIGAFVISDGTGDATNTGPSSFDALVKSNIKMGAVLGGWYGPAFEKALKTAPGFRSRLQTFEDFETLFRALEAGLVQVAINDVASGRYMMGHLSTDRNVQLLPFSVHRNDVHLFFSQKTVTKADISVIDDAILAFQATSDYHDLLRQYLPAELVAKTPEVRK